MSRPTIRSRATALCAHCRGPITEGAYTPFCSQGCRDRDLLQWLGDGHRIPGPPAYEEGEEILRNGLDSDGEAPL